MKWFKRKDLKVTVEFNGQNYVLGEGYTLWIQHSINIEGDVTGTLSPIALPVKVVSID